MLSGNVHTYVAGNVCAPKKSIYVCDEQSVHDNRLCTETGRVPGIEWAHIIVFLHIYKMALSILLVRIGCSATKRCTTFAVYVCFWPFATEAFVYSLKFHELGIVWLMLLVCIIAVHWKLDGWCGYLWHIPWFGQLCTILQSHRCKHPCRTLIDLQC